MANNTNQQCCGELGISQPNGRNVNSYRGLTNSREIFLKLSWFSSLIFEYVFQKKCNQHLKEISSAHGFCDFIHNKWHLDLPKWPSTKEWIKKFTYKHCRIFSHKEKYILSFLPKLTELEDILLTNASQAQGVVTEEILRLAMQPINYKFALKFCFSS